MSKSLLTASAALSLLFSSVAGAYFEYSTVTGYFIQDDAATVPGTFSYVDNNFGLIDQVYDTDAVFDPTGVAPGWSRFENKLKVLNSNAPEDTTYKLFYLGRHGEGYHNVAETYYGTPAWNCYWSELNGNGTSVWADAEITPNGANQAIIAHNFWISQIQDQKQTLPQSFYTSPLTRCLHTAAITFDGLTPETFSAQVKEFFREGISMHTCDRRSSKSYIHENYPTYTFDADFTETDELWQGFEAETSAAEDLRLRKAVDDVFWNDDNSFVSVTAHSGAIASTLRVLGHRTFSLVTGAVIPVLVKAVKINSDPVPTTVVSWAAEATCTVPPLSSVAGVGCVCPPPTATLTSTSATVTATTTSASVTGTTTSASVTGTTTSASVSGTATTIPTSSSSSSSSSSYTPSGSGSPSGSSGSSAIYGNSTTTHGQHTSVHLTTSTVKTTFTSTITSCPAHVHDCTVGGVTTITKILYTTTCPVSAEATSTSKASTKPAAETTSVVYATTVYTITKCPASVSCTVGHVTTESTPLYTVTVAVTPAPYAISSKGNSTVPSATGTAGSVAPTASFVTGAAAVKQLSLSAAAAVLFGVVAFAL